MSSQGTAGRGPGDGAGDDEAVGNSAPRPPSPPQGGKRDESVSTGESGWRPFARDLVTSVLAVLLVGAYLFAVSGVWPPMVAIESGSMIPHMEKNDLVFVMEESRFDGRGATHGVVTARVGNESDYRMFQGPGDVVVYRPEGRNDTTPIIHRAMFWVEDGENWVERADPSYLQGVGNCSEISSCPAEYGGFITKGDNNGHYDQATRLPSCEGECDPVRPAWIVGTAEVRIPGLGWLRLRS